MFERQLPQLAVVGNYKKAGYAISSQSAKRSADSARQAKVLYQHSTLIRLRA